MSNRFINVPTYPIPVLKKGVSYTFRYSFLDPTEVVFLGYRIQNGFDRNHPDKACIIAHLSVGGREYDADCFDFVPSMDIFDGDSRVAYAMSDELFGLDGLKVLSTQPFYGVPSRTYMDGCGDIITFSGIELKEPD